MTNPLITIDVTLTPHKGKANGYQFRYVSSSGLVTPDGRIDLSNYPHDLVDLAFVLKPTDGLQPEFPVETDDAIWFVKWPKGKPPPVPCPISPLPGKGSFFDFARPNARKLTFTDRNNDNQRFAYALRCLVPGVADPVADDPVIINKIAQA